MSARKLIILAHFCSDYHSGQTSRGYRILCKVTARLRSLGITWRDEPKHRNTSIYKYFVNNYQNKV